MNLKDTCPGWMGRWEVGSDSDIKANLILTEAEVSTWTELLDLLFVFVTYFVVTIVMRNLPKFDEISQKH